MALRTIKYRMKSMTTYTLASFFYRPPDSGHQFTTFAVNVTISEDYSQGHLTRSRTP